MQTGVVHLFFTGCERSLCRGTSTARASPRTPCIPSELTTPKDKSAARVIDDAVVLIANMLARRPSAFLLALGDVSAAV